MAESSLIKRIPPRSFSEPDGKSIGLFVPAMHQCDEGRYREWLKSHPTQENTTERQTMIEDCLIAVHETFEELNMPTILEAGSLLGYFRNCGVIPTDADGDVALLAPWLKGKRSLEALSKAFEKRNGSLSTSMCPDGPTTTGCELRVSFKDSAYIDIFVYAAEKECPIAPCSFFTSLRPNSGDGVSFYKCDVSDVHFEQALFLNKTFWIPTPTLRYLKQNYGEDWSEPGGGVYKTCHMNEFVKPAPDIYANLTPPAGYVMRLMETYRNQVAQARAEIDGDAQDGELEDGEQRDEDDVSPPRHWGSRYHFTPSARGKKRRLSQPTSTSEDVVDDDLVSDDQEGDDPPPQWEYSEPTLAEASETMERHVTQNPTASSIESASPKSKVVVITRVIKVPEVETTVPEVETTTHEVETTTPLPEISLPEPKKCSLKRKLSTRAASAARKARAVADPKATSGTNPKVTAGTDPMDVAGDYPTEATETETAATEAAGTESAGIDGAGIAGTPLPGSARDDPEAMPADATGRASNIPKAAAAAKKKTKMASTSVAKARMPKMKGKLPKQNLKNAKARLKQKLKMGAATAPSPSIVAGPLATTAGAAPAAGPKTKSKFALKAAQKAAPKAGVSGGQPKASSRVAPWATPAKALAAKKKRELKTKAERAALKNPVVKQQMARLAKEKKAEAVRLAKELADEKLAQQLDEVQGFDQDSAASKRAAAQAKKDEEEKARKQEEDEKKARAADAARKKKQAKAKALKSAAAKEKAKMLREERQQKQKEAKEEKDKKDKEDKEEKAKADKEAKDAARKREKLEKMQKEAQDRKEKIKKAADEMAEKRAKQAQELAERKIEAAQAKQERKLKDIADKMELAIMKAPSSLFAEEEEMPWSGSGHERGDHPSTYRRRTSHDEFGEELTRGTGQHTDDHLGRENSFRDRERDATSFVAGTDRRGHHDHRYSSRSRAPLRSTLYEESKSGGHSNGFVVEDSREQRTRW
eukprot:TRINITY_DN5630_c0_g1_i1.p1 TRINITY_DN5630_c0_g1~~TRINITY_DN5630_c0_g1_i1.p1  ORF type:complete len:1070 (-),score=223.63 TRINITY_DN5630_c0_g1_i1:93-3056(-)